MKRFFLLSLFCALLSLGAWAEEAVYKTAKFGTQATSGTSSSYTTTYNSVTDGFSVSVANGNTNGTSWDCVKFGRKGNASVGSITTSAAIDKAVTKVVVTIDAITASNVNSITLYSGSSANACTTSEGTFTKSTGEQTVNISAPAANKFYMVTLDCKSGSGNGFVAVSKVEYYYNNGGSTPTVTAPAFDVAAGTVYGDQLVLIDNYDGNYLYAYTTDGSDPAFDAELNVTNGTAYDNDEGIEITTSCTLKAIAVDEDGNASSITSAVYTVVPSIANTSDHPYTVAEAIALIESTTAEQLNAEAVYVIGTVSEIVTAWSDQYKNITYNISADGTTTSDQFQLFRCATNGAEVGDVVIAKGTLYKHTDGTYELKTGNEIVDIQKKTITALEVSGTPTKTTYNVGDAFETAGLVVTATYSDNTTATIATGFEWEIDYGTGNEALVAGATSVDVAVYTEGQEVMSEVYTVNGLTVTVPVTLTSIAVSGTPTKTAYYVGDAFDPAGLVVTGTFSDSHQETITEGLEWTVDPETLALGTTSVDVMAGVGSVVSEVYTVNGLTVTKPDFETATYEFSEFASGQTVELTDLDGFVITLKHNGGTNPAWSSNQARVYAKGSLTVKANNAIIKSIEYVYTVNANKNGVSPTIDGVEGTTDAGTWDVENKTWTGADEEVTFSTSGTAGNVGFTKLIIKYTESTKIATSLEWSADAAEVTIGAADNVFPTLTTTPADLAGVTYESSKTDVATIAADGTITLVKAGETTITAKYEGDAEHAAATSVSYTLTVVKAPFVPTPVAEGYETVDFTTLEPYKSLATNGSAEMTTYEGTSFSAEFAKKSGTSNAPKYYQNGGAVRCYVDNTITITGAENITDVNIAWAGNYVDDAATITGLGTTTVVVTFSNTCRFTAITVDYRPIISFEANEMKTYSSAYPFEVDGAEVYTATVTHDQITLYKVESAQVPAGVGVILYSENGGDATISKRESATELTNNHLQATTTAEGALVNKADVEGDIYVLADGNVFLQYTGAAFAANRAFVIRPAAQGTPNGAPMRVVFATEVATDIEAVETEKAVKFFENGTLYIQKNGRVYNVAGMLVK